MTAIDLSGHPFFTSWSGPASGVESHILTERVAPWRKDSPDIWRMDVEGNLEKLFSLPEALPPPRAAPSTRRCVRWPG